ncbi:MAG: hypothetical protein HY231_14405 [Acidobacteria bacterium]|nr:hypothetical protein [Acidobacteriota bacterium]
MMGIEKRLFLLDIFLPHPHFDTAPIMKLRRFIKGFPLLPAYQNALHQVQFFSFDKEQKPMR